jgi:very-short-patch-repair endonuclease
VAADDGADAAGKALDSMLRRGDSAEWVRQTSARWRKRGVVGPAVVMRLLDERVDGRLPRSWFQRLAKRTLAARGIRLVDELVVRDPSGVALAELDLANPALKVGVECQSWRWHATPSARAADARRKRRLRHLGWEIVEVWWSDLDDMDDVEAELRLVIDRRRPLLC